jgi:YD repeat-containing protein
MSCFITQGVSLNECADSIGGIKKVYIAGGIGTEDGGITAFTYDADDQITGSTVASGTTLYGFEVKRNTSSLTQTITKSFENGTVYFEQVLELVMFKYDKDKRKILDALVKKDNLQIIAIDQNETQYMLGQVRGMYVSGGTAETGTALGDRNGFTITFQGDEPIPARIVEGSIATVFSGATIVG